MESALPTDASPDDVRLDRAPENEALPPGLRVFVAEDEAMLLWVLQEALGGFGCKVAGTATRVADALAFTTGQSFDLAILDGMLEDGSIDPVVDVLVARKIPFVIATGSSAQNMPSSFARGVTLQKPYRDADLKNAMLVSLASLARCAVSPIAA